MVLTKIRYKIINLLLKDDEKYLIIRAIDDRRDTLEKRRILDRSVDSFDSDIDIEDYKTFRDVFSVDGSWV